MIDIVHLDDIFVMFPSEHGEDAVRKKSLKLTSLPGMFRAIRCSINGLRCTIVPMEIRRDA
jgi:hypothetical protein